jgi:hypothetical protein
MQMRTLSCTPNWPGEASGFSESLDTHHGPGMQNRDGPPSYLFQRHAISGTSSDKTHFILFGTTNFLFHAAIRGERKYSLAHFANVCVSEAA